MARTMHDLFLHVDGVPGIERAIEYAIGAALQRNKVYAREEDDGGRAGFRQRWGQLMEEEAKPYYQQNSNISDEQHCSAIARISDTLSAEYADRLVGGRLRFGTSQKAFNVYLKYLWAFRRIAAPPHCPVDRIVLDRLGVDACWTRSDSRDEYMSWINAIRRHLTPAHWENDVWLRSVLGGIEPDTG